MKSTVQGIGLFFGSFIVAGYLATSSWGGTVFVLLGDARSPAAVKNPNVGLHLSRTQLLEASRRQLVSDLKLIPRQDMVGIQLGQMLVRAEKGRYRTACDIYDRIVLTLEAEDLIESGHRPQIRIETLCVTSADYKRLETIWLPKNSMLKQLDPDAPVQVWEEDYPVAIKFSHMGSLWPQIWRLTDIELYHSQTNERTIWQKEELLSLKTAQELTIKIF